MKNFTKYLAIGIIVISIIYSSLYAYLVLNGKSLLISELEKLTKKKVTIGYFGMIPPLNVMVKHLNIEGMLKADSVFVSPSVLYLLTGNLAFNRISLVRPVITIEKTVAQNNHLPEQTPGDRLAAAEALVKSKKVRALRIIFKQVRIKDGKINFMDHTVGPQGIRIAVKDLNFYLDNLYLFPYPAMATFNLKGRIPWKAGQEDGKISLEGWANLYKRSMQAVLKVEDIDGIYLYPYYSQWVDLEKARIESASLKFISKIQGLDNDVTAECHLELTDIVRKARPPEEHEQQAEKITNTVLDIFKAMNQGNIVLDFTIRTKMDRPEFGLGNIRMAFEDKLAQARGAGFQPQDLFLLPGNVLQGFVRGATDLTKAMIDGTFAVGKEVRKSVEDTFYKLPKPPEEKKSK